MTPEPVAVPPHPATWDVWDRLEYARNPHDRERGVYEAGFPSPGAAEAAIPRIQAAMAEAGDDIPAWRFVVVARA